MHHFITRSALACVAITALIGPAAAQSTLELSGTAQATCSLTSPTNGTITLDSDLRNWSTQTPASITATNTAAGAYTLTVTRSDNWKTSPVGTPSTTFDHTPSISGANTSANFTTGKARSTVLANAGVDTVSVSLTASGGSNPFRTGTHTTEVTVTCASEP